MQYAEHEVDESEQVRYLFPVIRTNSELKSEFVQTVQCEAEVLEVFAQSNIPRYEGIVDDTDIVTVQVIEKVNVVSHAYHTCEVDEDDKVHDVIEVIPFVVCALQAKEEVQVVVVAEEARVGVNDE